MDRTISPNLPPVSRRNIFQLAAGLASCGLIADASEAHAQEAVESELVFAGTGGGTQAVFEKEIFPDFAKRYGVKKLTYVPSPASENVAKLRTQRQRPSIDVIWLAGAVTYQAIDENLLARLDTDTVPNLALLPDEYRTEPAIAPVGLSVTGLIYNAKLFNEKGLKSPTSWWDMWDPRFKGHVGFNTINASSTVAMLALMSKELSGDPLNFDAALKKLRELKPNILDFYSSGGAMDTAVQQGDLWLWSEIGARAMQLSAAGLNTPFVIPKEGAVGYLASVAAVEGAPHPKVARAWINYLLSPEIQAKIAGKVGYAPVTKGVSIPESARPFIPASSAIFVPDWRKLSAALPTIVSRWNREVE